MIRLPLQMCTLAFPETHISNSRMCFQKHKVQFITTEKSMLKQGKYCSKIKPMIERPEKLFSNSLKEKEKKKIKDQIGSAPTKPFRAYIFILFIDSELRSPKVSACKRDLLP